LRILENEQHKDAMRELINLNMPDLYRIANLEEGNGETRNYVRPLHPIPTNEIDEIIMPFLKGKVGHD
jgi:hypothetical protein